MFLMAKTLGLEMEEEPGGLAPEGWGRGDGGDVTNLASQSLRWSLGGVGPLKEAWGRDKVLRPRPSAQPPSSRPPHPSSHRKLE